MSSLRVGTWNVEYAAGEAKNRARLARLEAADADVWVLTETHDDLDLSRTHPVSLSTDQRPTGRRGARWTTVWSRWPLRRLDVGDPVRTVAALVEAPAGPLVVYGTVLPWHSDPGPDPTRPKKAWSEQYRVIPEQGAEWKALAAAHPRAMLVVAGDLDMSLGGPHYYGTTDGRALLRDAMDGAGLACATETGRVPAGALAHPPIDHVLVRADRATAVVAAWEGRTDDGARMSDHSGLVVAIA